MISLCIISRKEDQSDLWNAVESCIDYVDEVIVVDTSKGVKIDPLKNDKIKVIPYKWDNDFASARNFSFSKASHEVILWIDSDDIIQHPENLKGLAKIIEDGKADWIYLDYIYAKDEHGNVIARHWKPRLIRKGTGNWCKSVHEDLEPIRAVIQVKDIDVSDDNVQIVHTRPEHKSKESAERNLEILLAEYKKDGEDTDPRTLQYLGYTFQGLEQYREAISFLQSHIRKTGSVSDKYWSMRRVSICAAQLGSFDQAIDYSLQSLRLFPEWKTAYFDLAEIYSNLEDWAKVIEWSLIGLTKDTPDVLDVTSDIEYTINPLCRLSYAYINTANFQLALETAHDALKFNPNDKRVIELVDICTELVNNENFVKAFLRVVAEFKKVDRVKTNQLFDILPSKLEDDIRIQQTRNMVCVPENWEDKSIVIYCGDSLEAWAYPSVFTGIGGSESAVIYLSKELADLGYKVTVYNKCGDMKGEYNGVEYKPFYHFNPKGNFNILIGWRTPNLFYEKINAKKKYVWLHDIANPQSFHPQAIENTDKFIFLSNWHRNNLPDLPDSKCYITNNGVDPKRFENLPEKEPNTLFWGSSYDRGLLPFIKNIFPHIIKKIPDVKLNVAYGWNNILKQMDFIPELKSLYEELSPILESHPNIIHHGRLSHRKLAELEGKCMTYPYASEFGETNNLTSQESQMAGCYVVTTSGSGGTPERVKYGIVIEDCPDIYTNDKKQREFADEVILSLNHTMHKPDLSDFYWSKTANNWSKEIL